MRILILGANGFIGSKVAHAAAGHFEVARADIFPGNAEDYFALDADQPDFLALIEQARPDVIVNCTGAASVPASFESPACDFTLNVVRMMQLLEAIRRLRRSIRVVHLSSAAVYGNPTSVPVGESALPAPVSPYGWHKRQAEMLCEEYSRLHRVETLSLRVFSAYGPGLRKQLFWDVFQKARRAGTIDLFGTGQETRDYIYVEDLADCIVMLIRKAGFDGRVVNVAAGVQVSTEHAVKTLLNKLGLERRLNFSGAGRRGDPDHWLADTSYITSLGFSPTHDMAAGLAITASWLKSQNDL